MKYYLILIIRQLMKFFFIFPIRRNRVMFISYNGKQYSCNPKYIYEKMILDVNKDIEYIWATTSTDDFRPKGNPKIVRYKSVKFIYFCLTSNVIVENSESWSILPKRNNQTVINTWHGGGAYKKVGIQRVDGNKFNEKNVLYKNNRIDKYVSSSELFTKLTLVESFNFNGEILPIGMPRNDIFFNDSLSAQEIKSNLNIGNKKVILVAPTFRNRDNYVFNDLDYDRIIKSLNIKNSSEWVLLYRTHYYSTADTIKINSMYIDVSSYPDMQELLYISDVLLTDYSSSMWDFSFSKKPVFLYTPDLDQYDNEERGFYIPIQEWPFPYSETLEGLLHNIESLDLDDYNQRVSDYHDKFVSYEGNNASEFISNLISDLID